MTDDPLCKAAFYAGSTLAGLSRINDDRHYTSQVFLGWWMAYLAATAVDQTQSGNWAIYPWPTADGRAWRSTTAGSCRLKKCATAGLSSSPVTFRWPPMLPFAERKATLWSISAANGQRPVEGYTGACEEPQGACWTGQQWHPQLANPASSTGWWTGAADVPASRPPRHRPARARRLVARREAW